jgi:hypothetical protein
MKFNTTEEVLDFLTSNIKTSYRERYSSVSIFSEGVSYKKIKFETKARYELHDSIQELLNANLVQYELKKTSEQTNLEVFYIPTGKITTRILIKPKGGREWLKQGFWNEALQSLPNWSTLINTPDNQTEFEILRKFNEQIAILGNGKPVDVQIKGGVFKDIIGMVSGPPGHKADFIGIDKNGQGQFFISHKAGNNSTDFQQYSGISPRSGDTIYRHEEVKSFRKDISEKTTEEFRGTMFYRTITDEKLKKYAVFGKDYNKSTLSSNNINFFAQGRPVFTVIQRCGKRNHARLKLDFSTKIVSRKQITQLSGDYEPLLGARQGEAYRTVDGTDSGGSRVTGVRAGVFAKGYIDSRKSEKI